MSQHLINLALALAAGDVVQDAIEAQQIRKKVRWLRQALEGKAYQDRLPFQIDRRWKSYGISLLGLVGFTTLLYPLFVLLHLAAATAFAVICVLIVISYWTTAVLIDRYHIEIGALTERARKDS